MLLLLLPIISIGHVGCAEMKSDLAGQAHYSLVWTADYDEGEQVFFSSDEQKHWSLPVQVSSATGMVFHAVSSSGSDGNKWAVWSEQNERGSFLLFSVNNSNRWLPSRRIETGMTNNKFSSMVVDTKNNPWIAWTASKESYSDIFWCKWNGNRWGRVVKAHSDNNVPDINPSLVLSESGDVLLSWKTIKDGGYVTVSQVWDGSNWNMVSEEIIEKSTMNIISAATTLSLPKNFDEDPRKTSLSIKSIEGAISVPLSFIQAIPVLR